MRLARRQIETEIVTHPGDGCPLLTCTGPARGGWLLAGSGSKTPTARPARSGALTAAAVLHAQRQQENVLRHLSSVPPADPPEILALEHTGAMSSCTDELYERRNFSATSGACCTHAHRSATSERMVLVETRSTILPVESMSYGSTFGLSPRSAPRKLGDCDSPGGGWGAGGLGGDGRVNNPRRCSFSGRFARHPPFIPRHPTCRLHRSAPSPEDHRAVGAIQCTSSACTCMARYRATPVNLKGSSAVGRLAMPQRPRFEYLRTTGIRRNEYRAEAWSRARL